MSLPDPDASRRRLRDAFEGHVPLDSLPSLLKSIAAISIGAVAGALLRWILGLKFNNLYPDIPPGTVIANMIGAYVIGAAIAYFATEPGIPGEWRLLIITGFCGSLTTFSTFSAEIVALLQQGRAAAAGGAVAIHVIGSVAMTFLGIGSVAWVRHGT